MSAEACPTCNKITHLFESTAALVMNEIVRGYEFDNAWGKLGEAWGVLVADPEIWGVLVANPITFKRLQSWRNVTAEEIAAIEPARPSGLYIVAMPLRELRELIETCQGHGKQSALACLDTMTAAEWVNLHDSERCTRDRPKLQVYVLGVLKNCVAGFPVNVDLKLVEAHLGLRQDDPVKVNKAPSRLETFMDPRLVRMVLRVSPELQEDLITISERLFDETRLEYSYAAIIRGLIALGLASIAGKVSLAAEFAGSRVPRGRKRRDGRATASPRSPRCV